MEVSYGGDFAGGSVGDDVGEFGRGESSVFGREEVVEMEELQEIGERGVGFDLRSHPISELEDGWK